MSIPVAPVEHRMFLYPADRAAFQYTEPGDPILVPYITPFVIYLDEETYYPATVYDPITGAVLPNSTVYTAETGLMNEFVVADVTRVWSVAQVGGEGAVPYPLDAAFGPRIDMLEQYILSGEDGHNLLSGEGPPRGTQGVNGDFYINETTSEIYGPKTAGLWGPPTSLVGPPGPRGPAGPPGGGGSGGGGFFTHYQDLDSELWDITHSLGYVPAVTVIDSGGTQIFGDTTVQSDSHMQVQFAFAFHGTAYLS